MSATETPETPNYTEADDREEVLDELEDAIDEALRKFLNGRVRDAQNEKIRIKWLRGYTNAVGEYRRLVADLEEAEHEERIERLESLIDDVPE